jgi:hypothetical protein
MHTVVHAVAQYRAVCRAALVVCRQREFIQPVHPPLCVFASLQAAAEAKHAAKQPAAGAADHNNSFKTPAPPKAATRLGGADAAGAAGVRAAAAAAAGREDSPSITITVLDPVSTGVCCLQQRYSAPFCVQYITYCSALGLVVASLKCCLFEMKHETYMLFVNPTCNDRTFGLRNTVGL